MPTFETSYFFTIMNDYTETLKLSYIYDNKSPSILTTVMNTSRCTNTQQFSPD